MMAILFKASVIMRTDRFENIVGSLQIFKAMAILFKILLIIQTDGTANFIDLIERRSGYSVSVAVLNSKLLQVLSYKVK